MPPYDPSNDPNRGNPGQGQQGYGQQGQQGYGQQGQQGYGRPARNGLGIAALVLGILAILLSITVVGGILFGIVAVVLGFIGRGRVKKGQATNGGIALAGIITGLLGILLSIALFALGAAAFFGVGGDELLNCVNSSDGSPAAVEQCNQQFQQNLENTGG